MKFLWLVSTVAILVAIVPNLISAKAPPGRKGLSHRRIHRCGFSRHGLGGYVVSPYYPRYYRNNMLCTYRISVPRGKIIEVKFLDFDLEYHRTCAFDYLELKNGASQHSQLMGKFCGSTKPPVMLARSGSLYMTFKTDFSVTKRGFRMWWRAVPRAVGRCPNTPRALSGGRGLQGIITTPHYPRNYGNNQLCVWTLSAPAGHRIRLRIVDFKLESSYGCRWDHVELRNGRYPFSPRIGKYCGIRRPWTVVSRGRTMRIEFKSDGSVTKKGMKAYYKTFY